MKRTRCGVVGEDATICDNGVDGVDGVSDDDRGEEGEVVLK